MRLPFLSSISWVKFACAERVLLIKFFSLPMASAWAVAVTASNKENAVFLNIQSLPPQRHSDTEEKQEKINRNSVCSVFGFLRVSLANFIPSLRAQSLHGCRCSASTTQSRRAPFLPPAAPRGYSRYANDAAPAKLKHGGISALCPLPGRTADRLRHPRHPPHRRFLPPSLPTRSARPQCSLAHLVP